MSDAESDRIARATLRDRFFAAFGLFHDAALAEHLDASPRAVARWRAATAVPQAEVARRMRHLLERGRHVLAVDETELARLGEAARLREEAAQQRIRHTEVQARLGAVPVPPWYAHALDLIRAERWREAEAVLRFWAEPGPQGGLAQVPAPTRPHMLQSYGLCLYYLGQRAEAGEAWRRGLAEAGPGTDRDVLLGLRLMVCSSLWRRREFAAAFAGYDALVREAPGYAYAYYNALCCADAARDATALARWMGATEIAALNQFAAAALEELLTRMAADEDLHWARMQPLWTGFAARLGETLASMRRQMRLP